MALQVWLPLNGNLNNQGLSDVTVTNNGATVDSNGKIGQCYSIGSSKRIYSTIDTSKLNSNAISFTCWVYVTSWNSSYDSIMSIADGTGWNQSRATLCRNNTASTLTWNIANNSSSARVSSTSSISLNTWTHIATTYDGATLKIYINGILDNSTTTTLSIIYAGGLNIGSWINSNNYPLTGKICDVRVYDNALSPKEVAEIAKGLVLHYPLNREGFGLDNLLKTTPKAYSATSYNAYQLNLSENLISGQTYTIQLWDVDVSHTGKTEPNTGVWVYWGGGSVQLLSWAGSTYFTNGHADHLEKTFTITSSQASGRGASNAWLNIYNSVPSASGTMNMSIGRWKLEKGSTATPWVPNSADTIYTTMGLNGTTVADTSGYCHNGTATALTYSSDTPRYSVSPYFNGSTSKIAVPNIYTTGVKNTQMSFAFWMKRDNYSDSKDHHIYNDICRIYTYSGDYKMRISWEHDTASSTANNTWAPGLSVPANQWHHVCFTYDSGVMKVYSDGVLYGTSDRTNTGQFIGVYNSGFVGWRDSQQYGGCLSDFRIYATALTADQVKQLYEAPISLANNGTLFANEFNET